MNPEADHHEYCSGGFSPDDIVISGVAGRFPTVDNVGQLKEALFEKKNLVIPTDERFEKGAHDVPFSSSGIINDIDRFDNEFFGIPSACSHLMDPSQRKTLEVCYEAILDSGYDPHDLKGSNIGVYHALANQDGRDMLIYQGCGDLELKNFAVGCLRTMNANRFSFIGDFHGPSFTLDTACSSSAVALWSAFHDIKNGIVDAAVVSGVQLCLSPAFTYFYIKSGIVSTTGNSAPFDADTDGMTRTEAVNAVFIQKASTARRAYATIAHVKHTAAGYVPEGVYVPSFKEEVKLFQATLNEIGLNPADVSYVEAHGTGTAVGDPIELNAVAEVFCKDKDKPLYVGTIKSNIGHTEAASGLCGVIKSVIAFESGKVPPNIKYRTPNPACESLLNGQLQVVTDPILLPSPYIIVNSFGFGGSLVNIILKQNPIVDVNKCQPSVLPKLALYSATTEAAVLFLFQFLKDNPELPAEFFALLHKIAYTPTLLKPFRGYALLDHSAEPVIEAKHSLSDKREIWFVMTGMGCQWSGMGLELMKIDVFAQSMMRSAEVLKPYGIDLLTILRKDKNYLEVDRKITPAFVSITAIQIALIDLLKYIEINPDGIVGHSTGELVCAYADGCCTAEQTILSAYWRGKAVESSKLASGAMAAVGLTWEDAKRRCPENVYPACHNADDSVTISGLKNNVESFVNKLKEENVFAKVVNAYGYAFHCQLVWPAAAMLKSALSELIPNPKSRTEHWVSSSYPEEEMEKEACQIAGAEYFVHNLMSPVLFNEAVKKIPSNAITIEIGPHFLLQSILKRVIGADASYIGLMKRNDDNNIKFLMQSLGKLYVEGLDPKIEKLYPAVKFPVPRNIPMISDLIKWNYSQKWYIPKWTAKTSEYSQSFDLEGADNYLIDHCINGKSLFPATGYVVLAWQALASKLNRPFAEVPFVIENFKIHRATILNQSKKVTFRVTILEASGDFEIIEGNSIVSSGKIYQPKSISFDDPEPLFKCRDFASLISGEDVYNELKIYGYQYGPCFRELVEMNIDATEGLVSWNERWIPFLDALLLFFGLVNESRFFPLPTGALSFKIDPKVLREHLTNPKDSDVRGFPVNFNQFSKRCRSSGIEITELNVDPAPQHSSSENLPTFEKYTFIPYINPPTFYCLQDKQLQYMNICNSIMKKIANITGKKVQLPQTFFDKESDVDENELATEQSLLHTLRQVSKLNFQNSPMKNLKELFYRYVKNLGCDPLNYVLLNDECLRVIFDIISENSIKKLNILEIHEGFSPVLPHLSESVQKYLDLKFKNKTLVSSDESIGEKLEPYDIKVKPFSDLISIAEDKNQNIVISSFFCGSVTDLRNQLKLLVSLIDEDGFIIMFVKNQLLAAESFLCSLCNEDIPVQPASTVENIFTLEDLVVISKIADTLGCSLYLLRPSVSPKSSKVIHVLEDNKNQWLSELQSALQDKTYDRVWLVSEDFPDNGIIGMAKCLRQEPNGDKIRCLFRTDPISKTKLPAFSLEEPFYNEILKKNLLMNVWKDNCWGSFRHIKINKDKHMRKVDHSFINCTKYGDLSSFQWIESAVKYISPPESSLVHIYYSAINFKDVMLATGKLSIGTSKDVLEDDECVLGFELSGRNSSGKRVAGICGSRGMATATTLHPLLTFEIPDQWTLEEAATVPVVYATCFYALFIRAKLQPRESILIHSGTGGIGLAAINIALSLNCEIFVTVGNEQKKNYLQQMFPQIKSQNIGCSRNTSFKDLIMQNTKGKGVNVVLNSLADEKFQASIQCVAKHGRFIEIGKYDLALDHSLGLKRFLKNISFHGVFLDQLLDNEESSQNILRQISQLIKEGIRNGVVKPLKRTVFEKDEVEAAFRYMASGTHIGKVLLKIRNEEPEKNSVPQILKLPAIPMTYFYSHKVYIIIGGLGGFGVELTKWLTRRGARNIVLTSRYGARTPYHNLCLKRWKSEGFNVSVFTLNASIKDEAKMLLQEASKIGPVGGIFNSAVVLKDAFLENQTADNFKEVCLPKAVATRNLDELSRHMCPSLDYFICFSSISCGKGNAGQTNYGYANSVMERVCEQRRAAGLHGLAVQWGIIGDVGVVHRHMGEDARIAGVCAQSVKSCLNTLDTFCQLENPVLSSYVIADSSKKKDGQVDTLHQLAKIFGLSDPSEFNPYRSFGEMGLDSMIGIEVKHLLETTYDISLTMQEIQDLKINDVKVIIEKAESESANKNERASALLTTSTIKLPEFICCDHPVVPLNTSSNGTPVFIVNIDDAPISNLSQLGKVLTIPAFALVWCKDSPTNNLETLAAWYLKEIRKVTDQPIHLIGYLNLSGCLAFEMFLQDEKNIDSLTLLTGSTHIISIINKDFDLSATESDILLDYVQSLIPGQATKLQNDLTKAANFDQKVRVIMNALAMSCPQTVNKAQLNDAIRSYVKKISLIRKYYPKTKLHKNISLIEDSSLILANDVTEVKRILSKVSVGEVVIHRISDCVLSASNINKIASVLNKSF
ncbi:fatty acid synthase-like [Uloborus diversus]|uniref:fatty acid synthase-like n=1 Tax=Uloborus diversus TaxID=327109 RepID=UPI002408F73C|nr:fatty acid synthase-like [Uloborus diversus]